MSSRKFLIAANWKMNAMPAGATGAGSPYHPRSDMDVVVFPTLLDVHALVTAKIATGAQCGRIEENGAFTGDVSMQQIAAVGCRYVLCGHSERRQFHGETDELVADQAIAALEHKLHPIICIGETEKERESGKEKTVMKRQLKSLPLESDITLAYEPVWAIGTGNTATPEQAEEMHAYIREHLPADRRETTRILYGGSMKSENAEQLLKQPNIDGGLIGGASLKPDQLAAIIQIAAGIGTR